MTDLSRLRALEGVKWTRYPDDVLPLWVADMDVPPPQPVTDVLAAMVDRGDLGYHAAVDGLVPAWTRWQERHHGWSPDPGDTWPFTGAMHALEALMVLHTRPGDGVVILSPIYEPFRTAIVTSGRRVVDVPLEPETWTIDGDRLLDAVDPGTRVILLCQPHNPTGRVFTAEELSRVAEVAEHRDLLVISDEIWADLVHEPGGHRTVASADARLGPRSITIGSASKSFSLAGLRCAVAHVGSEQIRRSLRAFPPHLLGAPSSLSAAASVAAWSAGEPWLDDVRAGIAARFDQLGRRLAADVPEVGFRRPQATYLGWLDFRRTGLGDDPSRRLLRDAAVALEPGLRFGAQGAGWARINVATSAAILDEAIDRIVAGVRGAR